MLWRIIFFRKAKTRSKKEHFFPSEKLKCPSYSKQLRDAFLRGIRPHTRAAIWPTASHAQRGLSLGKGRPGTRGSQHQQRKGRESSPEGAGKRVQGASSPRGVREEPSREHNLQNGQIRDARSENRAMNYGKPKRNRASTAAVGGKKGRQGGGERLWEVDTDTESNKGGEKVSCVIKSKKGLCDKMV